MLVWVGLALALCAHVPWPRFPHLSREGLTRLLSGLPASTRLLLMPLPVSAVPSPPPAVSLSLLAPLLATHQGLCSPQRTAVIWAPSRSQPGVRRRLAFASKFSDTLAQSCGWQMEADKLNKLGHNHSLADVTLNSLRPH